MPSIGRATAAQGNGEGFGRRSEVVGLGVSLFFVLAAPKGLNALSLSPTASGAAKSLSDRCRTSFGWPTKKVSVGRGKVDSGPSLRQGRSLLVTSSFLLAGGRKGEGLAETLRLGLSAVVSQRPLRVRI